MRTIICLLSVAACLAAASADEVALRGMPPFAGVTVLDVRAGDLVMQNVGGVESSKPLADIERIELTDQTVFNSAEAAAKAGKYLDAVAAYELVIAKGAGTWIERLARCRMIAAADKGGMIDRAVQQWLAAADEAKGADKVLALRPQTPAKKGAKENDKAINLLEKAVARTPALPPKYLAAARELLLKLYQEQGSDKADALAEQIAAAGPAGDGKTGAPPAPGGTVTPAPSAGRTAIEAPLAMLAGLLNGAATAEQAQQAIAQVQPALATLGDADRCRALLAVAMAQAKLAEKAEPAAARTLWTQAGLNAARIVAYSPGSSHAPGALYLAAQSAKALGNAPAAERSLDELLRRFPDSPQAAKAKADRPH